MMSFIIQKSEYLQQRLPFHYRVSKTVKPNKKK